MLHRSRLDDFGAGVCLCQHAGMSLVFLSRSLLVFVLHTTYEKAAEVKSLRSNIFSNVNMLSVLSCFVTF